MEKYQALMQIASSLNLEISNPLTAIIGNIEFLLMKYTDMDEQMEKKLKVILNESRRIEDILKKTPRCQKNGEKMIDVDRLSEKTGRKILPEIGRKFTF